jgi:hypothetical protein
MATQKERRAAPRKPGTSKAGATAAPQPPVQAREMPASPASRRAPPSEQPAPEDIRRRIEMAAYLRAKQRGFTPGYELDDWLKAEAEVKNRLQP